MDEEGTILGEYAPEKEFDTMILSVPGMEEGNVYHVKTGEGDENEIQITVDGRETVLGTSPDGRERRGHEPGKGRNLQGGKPEEKPPKPPEGLGRREEEGAKNPESKKPPEDFRGNIS